MTNGRYDFTATLLPNGKVLVAGGNVTLFARPSAELYDPLSGNWSPTGNMPTVVAYHTATLMTNGSVLVAGGSTAGGHTQIFYATTGTWSNTASIRVARGEHTATLLPGGILLA